MSLNAGARGYLLKSDLEGDLLTAIEALGAHKSFLTAMVTESLLASFLTADRESTSSQSSRAQHGAADRSRAHQQADRKRPQHQDCGNTASNIKSKAQYEDFRRYCALHNPQRAHRALSSATVSPLLLNAMEAAEGSSKVARARIATWVGVFRRTRHRASDLFPPLALPAKEHGRGLAARGG
jgi:hypothetical protein